MSAGGDWKRLEALFHGALERPEPEREAWLGNECDDEEMLRQVSAMLAADADADDPGEDLVSATLQDLASGAQGAAGKSLGPWRILEELGSGGMGSVFLAERADDEYRRRVALKLIRGFPDPASLERLRSERQILADLNHPNIAAMIDGGTTDDGQPYLVMEYIDGVPVDQWCTDAGPSLERRAELFREICGAVQYAHRNLVIHRDLKPNNVLVTAEGRPVLLDFGIAKLVDPGSDEPDDVTRGARYYTPGFSSPEQLAGAPVSTASDVYSLGKLFELMLAAGRGNTEAAPHDLQAIVGRATADDPADRYSSVEALAADVAAFLEGRPVQAASRRFGYRAWKFVRRHRLAVGTASVVAVAILGLIGQVVIESQRSREAEAQARIEAANANQVLEFLLELIESAGPGQARGEDVTVMQVLEQGRDRISAEAIADPALRARTLFALGSVYRALESHEIAQQLLAESAALARALGDAEEEVRALNVLGMSAVLNSDRQLAEDSLFRAVSLVRENIDIEAGERASAINDLGLMHIEFDDAAKGRELIAEALVIREQAGLAEERIATSYHNLAEAEDVLGNHREAMRLYRRALEMKERTVGKMHPSYANSLNGLGLASRNVGEWETSRAAIEEQMEIRKKLFGPDAPILYRDYNELAGFQLDMGRFEQAIENWRHAMRLEASNIGGATQEWLFLNNIGFAYKEMGLPERAEEFYRQSVALRAARFGDDSPTTARARHNLARVLLHQGRLDEARALADESMAVRLTELGQSHPDTVTSLLLSERIDHARDPSAERLDRMGELIAQLAEARSENSFGVLAARSAFARMLLDDGQTERARAEMESTIDRYRTQLVEGHPRAAALELDLVRLDLLEGRTDSARARLEAQRATLHEAFPETSRHRIKLTCLENGNTDPACWR